MEGGPWQFRRDPVVIVEYDGFTPVFEYALDMYPIWARIKGLPDGLTRKKELAEKVAKKVGEPPFTVVVNEGKINPSSHLRVRVFVNVQKPLVRFVPITLKERKRYPVSYEKLPDFCYFCGCMGHVVEECGDGVHDPAVCEWGDWLHWSSEPAMAGGGRGRGRGWTATGRGSDGASGAGRGRGRGGGGLGGRGGLGAQPIGREDDAGHRASDGVLAVPVANNIGDDDGRSARKRLIGADGVVMVRGQPVPNLAGKVPSAVLLLEGGRGTGANEAVPSSSTPGKVPIVKRRKQGDDGADGDTVMTNEAASFKGDRPAQ